MASACLEIDTTRDIAGLQIVRHRSPIPRIQQDMLNP